MQAPKPQSPLRPVDAQARDDARAMIAAMRHATLGVIDPLTGHPHLSRIAVQAGPDGVPVALLSGIAAHSRALATDPRAGLLIERAAPAKGDPLTHPRLSLQVLATVLPASPPGADSARRRRWLAAHPRAAVFIDLPDFRFWRLTPLSALLNAGFGATFQLTGSDLIAAHGETPPQA